MSTTTPDLSWEQIEDLRERFASCAPDAADRFRNGLELALWGPGGDPSEEEHDRRTKLSRAYHTYLTERLADDVFSRTIAWLAENHEPVEPEGN